MASHRVERRLAAILAADIVGYSRLVEQDEAGTLAAIKALREQAIDPLLAEHQGRMVKLMGDGAIVEFASVVDAVAGAVAVQQAVAEHQAEAPAERRIVFRIGINLGDVVVEGEDLLGDGVNVAARLEQLCEPGGVLVSGTAYDQLEGKLGLPLEFTGEQRVKNIERPVRAYRVRLDGKAARRALPRVGRRALAAIVAACLILAGAAGWWWRVDSRPAPSRPVVAVLPFATPAGADPRLVQLADGLATGIMDELSISRFFVVQGRSASFAYRDRPNPARALGQELGVTFVVEGTLQEVARQLRASVQLIDAVTGERLWSERFDRRLTDWSAVQDELGSRIGNAVNMSGIRPAIRERASGRPTSDLEAYELASLADDQHEQWTKEANVKGLALIDQALARDPRSSVALLIRAGLYRQQVTEGFAPAAEAMARWGEAAQALVDLDPNYAWGHLTLASRYGFSNKKASIALAEQTLAELDRVVELAPNNPGLLAQVAEQLPWQGQPQRAADLLDRAERFDPELRFDWRQYQVGFFTGHFREAANLIGGWTDFSRWDLLFATLSHAQLGDAAAVAQWRAQFVESWPEFSWELSVSESGDFAPAATAERALWLDSLAKAGLPICATPEQIERLKIKTLPECQTERAKPTLSPS